MYFLSIFTGLEFASVVITPDAWYHPTQTFFLTTLINKEYRVILHSGTSKVECLMQAAACIFVSRRINELPINKFWSIGGGAWSVAAVAMLIGLALPRFGGRQTSEQGGMTQLSDGESKNRVSLSQTAATKTGVIASHIRRVAYESCDEARSSMQQAADKYNENVDYEVLDHCYRCVFRSF